MPNIKKEQGPSAGETSALVHTFFLYTTDIQFKILNYGKKQKNITYIKGETSQ